nr:protein PA3071 [uncultured bacterium]
MIPAEVMAQIRRIQIRTNRMVDEILAGQYHSVFKGQGMEFKEVREYVVGDDIRSIDWNVTARTGGPHVKVMMEERELTVMLLVDASGSGRFGSVTRFKNELAAELCAVLAFSAIKNNDKVGLIIFTDDVELYVPPNKGRKHVLRVIREVLYFKPKKHGTNIPGALHYMNSVIKRRATVFVVSDFMADDYETALRVANKRHDMIAVAVTDPREEQLPNVGLAAVRDPETGVEVLVDTSDAGVRKAYTEAAALRASTRDGVFSRTRVDAVSIRTDRPYIDELHRFFRMRQRRKAA